MILKEIKELGEFILEIYGLKAAGWKFSFMLEPELTANREIKLGVCDYQVKTVRLNQQFAVTNDDECVFNALIHEIAHALTPGAEHGPDWLDRLERMGGTTGMPNSLLIPPGDWQGTCPNCGTRTPLLHFPQLLACKQCSESAPETPATEFAFSWQQLKVTLP